MYEWSTSFLLDVFHLFIGKSENFFHHIYIYSGGERLVGITVSGFSELRFKFLRFYRTLIFNGRLNLLTVVELPLLFNTLILQLGELCSHLLEFFLHVIELLSMCAHHLVVVQLNLSLSHISFLYLL